MLTTIQCRLGLPLPPKFIIFPFASPQISLPLEDIPPLLEILVLNHISPPLESNHLKKALQNNMAQREKLVA